jgi:methylenetetrahydrofolate--tRNA-(uracil-5-)-methyltransferase
LESSFLDAEGRAWNMVGFQTKLKYPEQKCVFRLVPGLANAEFCRLGSLHRNTYICSPALLDADFRLENFPMLCTSPGRSRASRGYLESAAIGDLVGRLISLRLRGMAEAPLPPATTALGARGRRSFTHWLALFGE